MCSLVLLPAALGLAGCDGPQSALDPAGAGAERLAQLFWVMLSAAVLIWVAVIGGAIYATRLRPEGHRTHTARAVIIGGGVVFPTIVLTALLSYGLYLMPGLRAQGDGLRIEVSGEQWWWRVRYWPPGAVQPVVSANEIRLPVGEKVEFVLDSPDVIHSFWIPPLGGKLDMIPGRTNRLLLEPTRVGEFRGACAEYCGTSHALMAFAVVVMERDAFASWLAQQAATAAEPADEEARTGRDLFLQVGCGGCHTVRGTAADGTIGPDLTHVGSRRTLGAGILPNERQALIRWIAATETVKPGSRMPSFGALRDAELAAIATWLMGLE